MRWLFCFNLYFGFVWFCFWLYLVLLWFCFMCERTFRPVHAQHTKNGDCSPFFVCCCHRRNSRILTLTCSSNIKCYCQCFIYIIMLIGYLAIFFVRCSAIISDKITQKRSIIVFCIDTWCTHLQTRFFKCTFIPYLWRIYFIRIYDIVTPYFIPN